MWLCAVTLHLRPRGIGPGCWYIPARPLRSVPKLALLRPSRLVALAAGDHVLLADLGELDGWLRLRRVGKIGFGHKVSHDEIARGLGVCLRLRLTDASASETLSKGPKYQKRVPLSRPPSNLGPPL